MTLINLLALTAVCAVPHVSNFSKEKTWTTFDQQTLDRSYSRCKKYYGERAPCVKVFIKIGTQVYRVLCGPKKGESNENKSK